MTLTPLRQAIVNQALWVVSHGSQWEYEEIRPVPLAAIKAGHLPIHTDCSGSIIGIALRAGAPDPSGYRYSGSGNTDSFYANCEHLPSYTDAQPGDIIDVGNTNGTVHAYLVTNRTATDLTVFSHGGPAGRPPAFESLNAVKAYWYGNGYRFTALRFLATTPSPPHWVILNGHGERLAKTSHPAIWTARHPRMFRKYQTIRFLQRA